MRNLFFRRASIFGAAILQLPITIASAQQSPPGVTPVSVTERYTFESRVLGERRTLDVTLPLGYADDASARYPVVLTLDGELEGELTAAVARFYGSTDMFPPVIVVAVHNTARMRDLTPPSLPPFTAPPGGGGGADRFLRFLSQEALPWLDQSFRTAPMRVLIGHSLGGLFALHALAQQPELFTGYVIMEPAAWWNNQQPVQAAREALTRSSARRARVMLVNAQSLSADTTAWGGDRAMVREIKVMDETHSSMAAIGIATGLRRLFEDFRPPQWRAGMSPVDMLNRYDSLTARVGYAVTVPEATLETVVRMALDSRLFADAERALTRMERTVGNTAAARQLRSRLAAERSQPAPAGFVPLAIPAERPSPARAAPFIGRWRSIDTAWPREIEVRAAGDTIIVHDRVTFPEGEPYDGDDPVIQITAAGTLEWGLPFFRGLAALLVQQGSLLDEDTLRVRQEARGWLPRDPNYDPSHVITYKRVRDGS